MFTTLRRATGRHDVAHLWAQQSSEKTRAKAGNVSFSGPSYVSYSTEMARFHHCQVRRKGTIPVEKTAVLFNCRHYSVSTSAHVSAARQAVRGLNVEVFDVVDTNPFNGRDHDKNWDHYLSSIRANVDNASRARSNKDGYLASARRLVDEANRYSAFFGLRKRLPDDVEAIAAKLEKDKIRLANSEKRRLARIERERLPKAIAALHEWTGDSSVKFIPDKTYLRVIGDGDERQIETSRYARLPLDHAVRALSLIRRCREQGQSFTPNGHTVRLGHFAVDEITPEGTVKAGCHVVEFDEIERIAKQLGL